MENSPTWANREENFHYALSALTLWMLDRSFQDQTAHWISKRRQGEPGNLQSPRNNTSQGMHASEETGVSVFFRPAFNPQHHGVMYKCTLSVCLWWCHGRQWQRLYWNQGKQHQLLSLVHETIHLIAEGYEASLAWFPTCKSMLTTPSDLQVLPVFGNGFQEDFLHHLPRGSGEAVQPIASKVFILVLLKGSNIWPLPVFRNLSKLPWPFKDN